MSFEKLNRQERNPAIVIDARNIPLQRTNELSIDNVISQLVMKSVQGMEIEFLFVEELRNLLFWQTEKIVI